MRASRRCCAAPVSSMNPMPPWICTPSEATSLPMSVENAFAIGVSSAPRAMASPRTFAALAALLRKRQRLLIGAVGDPDALEPDTEPGLVHHREHALHAAVFLADQVTDRAALVAHRHGAGWRGMHAELVLDAAGVDVVARAERAIGVDQEFWNQEQRNALGARRRIRQSRQHEMHDVIGHVVIAIGDENLGAGDAIAAVGSALGAGAQRADVRSRLRLGELHGAGPLAGHQLFEIDLFQLNAAVGIERLDRTRSEEHTSELQSRVDLVCRLLLEKKKEHFFTTIQLNNKKTK